MANLSNLNNKFIVTDGGNALINATANLTTYGGLTIDNISNPSIAMKTNSASGWIYTQYINSSGTNNFSMGVNQTIPYWGVKTGAGMDNPALAIISSGNVGIGTISPGAKLDIATTGSVAKPPSLRISNAAAAGYLWDIWRDNTTGYLNIGSTTSGTDYGAHVTIKDVSGNVGIGTTLPNYKLHVSDTSIDTLLRVENTTTNKYPHISLKALDAEYHIGVGGTGTATGYVNNLYFYDQTNAAPRVTLTQAGNLGIGTSTNINAPLTVQSNGSAGTINLIGRQNGIYDESVISFYDNDGTTRKGYIANSGGNMYFAQGNGLENLAILSGGNVGIGTGTPYSKLQVNSAVNTLGSHFGQGQNNTSGSFGGISLGYAENANASYRKVAIVAQATGDNAARQNLLFLVDSSTDSNSASIADNKMILNYDGKIKIGNGSNIAIAANGQQYHAAGPSGLSMREYEGYFDIPNGSYIDLFQNSSAYTDVAMVQISITMYHSSRTYFAGMGTVGGYALSLTGAGIGQANGGLTAAVVSTGIRKLQLYNGSGFTATARIYIQVRTESGITVLNGSLSAPY